MVVKSLKKCVAIILKWINWLIPKRYISFSSIPDFSDNPQALFDYMMRNRLLENKTIVWHLMSNDAKGTIERWINDEFRKLNCRIIIIKKFTLKSIWLFMRSKVIIDSHGMYDFRTNRQMEVCLWHGMPVKRIGFLLHGLPQREKLGFGRFFSVTSNEFVNIFSDVFYVKQELIHIDGQPRNDYLFNPVEEYCGIKDYIIYLPTFRKSIKKTNISNYDCEYEADKLFNLSREDWRVISQVLNEQKLNLIIKPHPQDTLDNLLYIKDYQNILIINDRDLLMQHIPLYRLLAGSQALITDYSSVFIDYMLTDKPIAFFIPDYDSYKNSRGFIFDNPEEIMAGKICTTCEDINKFIRNYDIEGFINKRQYLDIKRRLNSIDSNISCQKICNDIKPFI